MSLYQYDDMMLVTRLTTLTVTVRYVDALLCLIKMDSYKFYLFQQYTHINIKYYIDFSSTRCSARSLIQARDSGSTRSMRSADTSISDLDVARLRKELAKKIERIVLLEFDLEMCRDELHSPWQSTG